MRITMGDAPWVKSTKLLRQEYKQAQVFPIASPNARLETTIIITETFRERATSCQLIQRRQ